MVFVLDVRYREYRRRTFLYEARTDKQYIKEISRLESNPLFLRLTIAPTNLDYPDMKHPY